MKILKLHKAKLKQKLINWSLLIFTSLLGLFFLELATRKIMPEYYLGDQLRFTVDENLFIRGIKNSEWRQTSAVGEFDVPVKFNEYGFRDTKNLQNAGDEDYFALGDSYTFGWAVREEERFANLIQKDSIQVYNIATPNDFAGYRNILDHFDRQGIKMKKLLVGVCMENDLQLYQSADRLPPTMTVPDSSLWWASKKWLKYNSSLYVFISTQIKSNQKLRNILHSAGLVAKHKFTDKYSQLDSTAVSSANMLTSILEEYQTLILIIPSRYLWTGNSEAADREAYLHQSFVERLQASGLDFIDLKPIMEVTGNPLQYHFSIDGHWNKKGHQLAADVIENYLSKPSNDQLGAQ